MNEDKEKVILSLKNGFSNLCRYVNPMLLSLIASNPTNLAYAKEKAGIPADVFAGVNGVTLKDGKISFDGKIGNKSSDYLARIILTVMKFDKTVRSAANIRYSPAIVDACEDLLFEVCIAGKAKNNAKISTMDWDVALCCEKIDGVPDIICYDGAGKNDAMIVVTGENPDLVTTRIYKIGERIIITTL